MSNLLLSRNKIESLLKDNIQITPHTNEKLDYFRTHIKTGYANYLKTKKKDVKTLEEFATLVILRHNSRMQNENITFQRTYYLNVNYIEKIIKDVIQTDVQKSDPLNIFVPPSIMPPLLVTFQNILNRRIQNYRNLNKESFDQLNQLVTFSLITSIYDYLQSGLTLLQFGKMNESLILWRTLLETVTTFLILEENPGLRGKYHERKKLALMRSGLLSASEQVIIEKRKETLVHAETRNIPYHIAERYGWAGALLSNKEEFSLKTLLEKVKLSDFSVHYTFASLFVHQYTIFPEDYQKKIDPLLYVLTLYFKIYDLTRYHISKYTGEEKDAKKLEGTLRSELSAHRGKFDDFCQLIKSL